MNTKHYCLMILSLITLSACSTMNSNFSCNATAGDTCLSLDEVNDMTEGRATPPITIIQKERRPLMKAEVRRVWVAPFVDSTGVKHPGALVYVPELSEKESV